MKITKQKTSDPMWIDEAGIKIPYARTTKYERAAETTVFKFATEAEKLNKALVAYKKAVMQEGERLYKLFTSENGQIGKGKGGASFYNFDRSIRVNINVQDKITFDENTIELAKNQMDELLMEGLEGAKDYIKPILMDAFSTSNGRLDTQKVLGMKKYKSKINHPKFDKMCDFIDQATRRPSSKEYYQIAVKDEHGEYQNIQLNFAAL